MGVKVLGFAHNLNFSLNKKRMKMMKKEKSPWASKMKLLLALPIITLLVFAFAKKEYVHMEQDIIESDNPSSIANDTDPTGLVTVKGTVTDNEGNPLTGANVILKGTSSGTVVDRDGSFVLEVPKSERAYVKNNGDGSQITIANAQSLIISFIGYGTHEYVFDTQNDADAKDVKILLHRSYFNITLPEIGSDEKVVSGALVEVPVAKIRKEKTAIGDVVELPPPPKRTKDEEIFTIVEDMPYYGQSGMYELAKDIQQQAAWVMDKTKDRGEAVVGFEVAANGSIVDPHIVNSSQSKMLDASAVKIIQKLDNWRPGIQRGKKVPVDLTVPVKFEE